ncbi:hypothetical protein ACFP47_00220 [Nesterenkonia lacusekhoensis]|uniref:FHA domain-containing protein n=1 Tax=Nesterenkonia lacusekhoensis TaxID=150832 RepID=A0ABS4T3N0_9MICC|nr:hypothetical protein [Nesterenkonia lacusekhoensis]MBP2319064.1 hypothetical protein [Nesterenkonia lacusekhoensis]
MFAGWSRRRRQNKVKPGDGHHLKAFRWWHLAHRSLFHLRMEGSTRVYAVSLDHFDLDEKAHLYLDGRHEAESTLPAAFPVPGGHIEVAASTFGVRRMHYVPQEGGPERQLTPDADSNEGYRARFAARHPLASRMIGVVSLVVLVVALVLGIPQLLEEITSIEAVADVVGTFSSPLHLPVWANTALVVAAALASFERALRLRHNWLLDGDADLDL